MSTSCSRRTRVTGMSLKPSRSIRAAASSASPGVVASTMPPPFPRPPICTWTFTATRPPSRSAAWRASWGVVTTAEATRGIPWRANSSFPWCSYRSIRSGLLRRGQALTQPVDDGGRGRAGGEDLLDAGVLELGDVVLRDDAATEHDHVVGTLLPEALDHTREQRHVRSRVTGQ